MSRPIIAALALVLMSAALPCPAEPSPERQKAVEALVAKLSAPDFATRQAAVEQLIALGADAAPLVSKTLAETTDAEVKLRCGMVMKALIGKNLVFGAGPSKITLDVKDAPLASVLEQLAAQTGNRLMVAADDLKEKTVTLAAKEMDYWQAVEALAVLAKADVVTGWDAGDEFFHLAAADGNQRLSAFSGPVVVRMDYCRKWIPFAGRSINQVLCTETPYRRIGKPWDRNEAGVDLGLWYFVEDRFKLLGGAMDVTSVTLPDGRNVLPKEAPAPRREAEWVPHGPPEFWGAVRVGLGEIPRTVDRIAEISGTVRLETGSGEREVEFEAFPEAVGETKHDGWEKKLDDWTISIAKTQVQTDWLIVTIGADLPDWMHASGYGFWLKGPDGKRTRGDNAFSVERLQHKGEFRVSFHGDYRKGPWSLVLVLPKTHETKEYPFTLKDVPLP